MAERDYEKELQAIMDGLADSLATARDEQIIEEARNAGEDVEGIAEELRTRLLGAIGDYRQRHLKTARAEYERAVAAIERRRVRLPETPEKRRALLNAVLASNPTLGNLVTAQYRDLKGLPDVDVEGCLGHLQVLGALDNFLNSTEDA